MKPIYKTSFLSTFIIIITINTHIKRQIITSSVIMNKNIQYQHQKYMQIYDDHLNNLNNNMFFRRNMYCLWIISIPNWVKNLKILQEVIIELLYFINIKFIFLFIAHMFNESSCNLCK
eukprot:490659_1